MKDKMLLGAAALLDVAEVLELLGGPSDLVLKWLSDHRLVREHFGREWVIWGDVLTALRKDDPAVTWLTTTQAAERLGVARSTLNACAPTAAAHRPDLVATVGSGRTRHTYRWRSDALGEAMAAGRPALEERVVMSCAPKRKRRNRPKGLREGVSLHAIASGKE